MYENRQIHQFPFSLCLLRNLQLDLETNALSEAANMSPTSRARSISRLIVERSTIAEKEFTCVGRAGSKSEYVSTKVAPSDTNSITDMLNLGGSSVHTTKKARILSFYRTIFAPIGKTVILPCKATGRPNAEIFWLDAEQNIIDAQNARQKVLQNGDLLISPLRWSDMGTYTCIARNPISKDSAETFLYPSVSSRFSTISTVNASAQIFYLSMIQ